VTHVSVGGEVHIEMFHVVARWQVSKLSQGSPRPSRGCYKRCFKGVSRVFQGCFKGVTRVLKGCYKSRHRRGSGGCGARYGICCPFPPGGWW
jgi:hypothetical protein